MRALLLALALLGPRPAAAADWYPLGPDFEWTYLAFEDLGPQGLGFSHKVVRKVMGVRPGFGGAFYWIRESSADPDVGPQASARYATDLLKLPFKPARDAADEVYFKDATGVYFKARTEPPFPSAAEFDKLCALYAADKAPFQRKANLYLPAAAAPGTKWEASASKVRVVKKGRWVSDALHRDWPEVLTVESVGPDHSRTELFAEGSGLIAWYAKSAKDKSYYELADRRLGGPRPNSGAAAELAELKLRGLLGPDQEEASAEDLRLLKDMRRAEREGAVDFLKAKAHTLAPYAVERRRPGQPLEVLLNAKGFETFQYHLSQAAIADFEGLGIEPKYVFYVVDAREQPLFDESGLLTPAGLEVYYPMRKGEKTVWKLPGQQSSEGDSAQALTLKAKGYDEVLPEEFKWLVEVTHCEEKRLKEEHGLKTFRDKKLNRKRYFFYKEEPFLGYVGVYRAGEHDAQKARDNALILEGGTCE